LQIVFGPFPKQIINTAVVELPVLIYH
jgi:hypothetical protein